METTKIVLVHGELWLWTSVQGTLGPASYKDVMDYPWDDTVKNLSNNTTVSGTDFNCAMSRLFVDKQLSKPFAATIKKPIGPREKLFKFSEQFSTVGTFKIGADIRDIAEEGTAVEVLNLVDIFKL